MRMQLSAVRRGRLDRPIRILLYGQPGVGKSTFAAGAPSPIFLGGEDGTEQLDVARFPEPQCWQDVLDGIGLLTTEQHDYRTLVVDTLDWLEPLVFAHVCAAAKKPDIEAFGYGKGYVAALDAWRVMLAALDRLRGTGVHLVLLAHAQVRTFRNPTAEDFDRYELKLNAKAAGLLTEWPDAVLFAQYEDLTHKQNDRAKAITTGARYLHTEHRPAWVAKNRYDLPPKLPLDWASFVGAIGQPADPIKLLAELEQLAPSLPADRQTALSRAMSLIGNDAVKLSKLVDKVRAEVGLA